MSLAHMLTQDVIHYAWQADHSLDELGNPDVTYADPVTLKGYVYKVALGHDEVVRDREVALSIWALVLGPNEQVTHRDRFEVFDRVFEVDGTIHPVWNPRTSSVHHLEIQLKLIEEVTVTGS